MCSFFRKSTMPFGAEIHFRPTSSGTGSMVASPSYCKLTRTQHWDSGSIAVCRVTRVLVEHLRRRHLIVRGPYESASGARDVSKE